jgi:hypothetical protein
MYIYNIDYLIEETLHSIHGCVSTGKEVNHIYIYIYIIQYRSYDYLIEETLHSIHG